MLGIKNSVLWGSVGPEAPEPHNIAWITTRKREIKRSSLNEGKQGFSSAAYPSLWTFPFYQKVEHSGAGEKV